MFSCIKKYVWTTAAILVTHIHAGVLSDYMRNNSKDAALIVVNLFAEQLIPGTKKSQKRQAHIIKKAMKYNIPIFAVHVAQIGEFKPENLLPSWCKPKFGCANRNIFRFEIFAASAFEDDKFKNKLQEKKVVKLIVIGAYMDMGIIEIVINALESNYEVFLDEKAVTNAMPELFGQRSDDDDGSGDEEEFKIMCSEILNRCSACSNSLTIHKKSDSGSKLSSMYNIGSPLGVGVE